MTQSVRSAAGNRPGSHVPGIELTHGRAVWVLASLGFSEGVGLSTFNYYIKSLRKLGIPFVRGEAGLGAGRMARYSYNHMMELGVALMLRVYGILPDPVVTGLIHFRHELYALYQQAYLESGCGQGAPVRIRVIGQVEFRMSGVYLDLGITYVRGQVLRFGPPQALSPALALRLFAGARQPGCPHVPFNLSALARDEVASAQQAPIIRRGPHSVSGHTTH